MKDAHGSTYLFIDTHVRGKIRLAMIPLDIHQKIAEKTFEGVRDVVSCADAFFGPRPSGACGIIVVAGPGSFSSIRGGVLLANLMSRLMGVPLYRVGHGASGIGHRQTDEPIDLDELRDQIAHGRLKPVTYVAPVYDQEPNITVRRRRITNC